MTAAEARGDDRSSAGDARVSGGALATGLAEGRLFVETVRRGRSAGGLAAQRPGAREGMPARAQTHHAKGPR